MTVRAPTRHCLFSDRWHLPLPSVPGVLVTERQGPCHLQRERKITLEWIITRESDISLRSQKCFNFIVHEKRKMTDWFTLKPQSTKHQRINKKSK
jgi:hypothetical protein